MPHEPRDILWCPEQDREPYPETVRCLCGEILEIPLVIRAAQTSNPDQSTLHQELIEAEFGWDAPQFDAPPPTADERKAAAALMGSSRSAAKLTALAVSQAAGAAARRGTGAACTCGRTDGTHASRCAAYRAWKARQRRAK